MKIERVVILLAALLATAGTARLGWWQLDRAAQKNALHAAMHAQRQLPALAEAELARDAAQLAAQLHRQVRVSGQWQAQATIYLDNRQMKGRPGFLVLTPMVLGDGTAVMVQRGWRPREFLDRTQVAAPPLPQGSAQLQARIALPPSRLYDFAEGGSGAIRQNLDLAAFARETGLKLRPLSLLMLSPEAGGQTGTDTLQRDWPEPAADVHKHYGYAFQWFALAALISGLYLWFQLIRPYRRAQSSR
jgi:surfeit locus 1 family protein